ncbi:MAG TPA: hypothetical protein VM008_13840 [Phycisphaerae bacterium]|nr:hypothetical protein [Phycisphaerae bacterium]
MGLYIVVFLVVSQVTEVLLFQERLPLPALMGGLPLVAGGVTMLSWRNPQMAK